MDSPVKPELFVSGGTGSSLAASNNPHLDHYFIYPEAKKRSESGAVACPVILLLGARIPLMWHSERTLSIDPMVDESIN